MVIINVTCRCGRPLKPIGNGVIVKDFLYCCGHEECRKAYGKK